MDKIRLISKAIQKNGVSTSARPELSKVAPDLFAVSTPVSGEMRMSGTESKQRATSTPSPSPTISERNSWSEYLTALQAPHLSRIDAKSENYDYKSAIRFTQGLNSVSKRKSANGALFSMSSERVAKVISILLQLPEAHQNSDQENRKIPKEYFGELPAITDDLIKDEKRFADYIGLITNCTFHYKGSSKSTGIIPKLLKSLLHPSNLRTAPLKSTMIFNDAIHYFGQKQDFATCRELYAQMKLEGFVPTTRTYNLLLMNLVRNQKMPKQKLPFDEAIFYLEQMMKNKTPADGKTWNACFLLLRDNISRAIFMEKMAEKNVPITSSLICSLLGTKEVSSSNFFEFLLANNIPVDNLIIKLCHKKLVEEEKYEESWKLLNRAGELNYNLRDPYFLEMFLRSFAEKGRIDMALLTFNTMTQEGVRPTAHCYDMLFKCLVRKGYHKKFHDVYNVLCKFYKGYGGYIVMSYWFAKARSIVKFNIGKHSTDFNVQKLDNLVKSCKWDEDRGMKWDCWFHYPEYREAFRSLGCIPVNKKMLAEQSSETAKSKREYLKKTKSNALINKLSRRKGYLNDFYGTLQKELNSRGIVEAHTRPK